jgi:hypothetical protein
MKRAKQAKAPEAAQFTVAIAPLLKKGGAHQRKDKRASRARLKAALRKNSEN